MHTKTDLFCLEVGGPAEFDGKDDAGQHGGGTHDVLRNMAGDGGAIALPMVQPRHIMMANGQYTDPRMMNMIAAEMFAPKPTTVFNALI